MLLGRTYNHNINHQNHKIMAVNQKAISAKIDNDLFEKLSSWCQIHGLKRNTALNMAIDSLLEHGIPKRWR